MTSRESIFVMFLLGDRHHNSVCGKRKAATRTRLVDELMKRFGQCKATRDNKEVISNTPLGIVRWCEKFRASRLHSPCFWASSQSFLMMFWWRNDKSSVSSKVIGLASAAAILLWKSGKNRSHDHVTTLWGGGMQAKASKIVILCYFPSIFYLIIIKIFRILKIVCEVTTPWWGRSVVWHTWPSC